MLPARPRDYAPAVERASKARRQLGLLHARPYLVMPQDAASREI
jgi:hypothetical protein